MDDTLNLRYSRRLRYSIDSDGRTIKDHRSGFLVCYADTGGGGIWHDDIEGIANDLVGALVRDGNFRNALREVATEQHGEVRLYRSENEDSSGKPYLTLSLRGVEVTGFTSTHDDLFLLSERVAQKLANLRIERRTAQRIRE